MARGVAIRSSSASAVTSGGVPMPAWTASRRVVAPANVRHQSGGLDRQRDGDVLPGGAEGAPSEADRDRYLDQVVADERVNGYDAGGVAAGDAAGTGSSMVNGASKSRKSSTM